MKLYLAVTADAYELPIAVTENAAEMAALCGLTKDSLLCAVSRKTVCKNRNAIILRLEVSDNEE